MKLVDYHRFIHSKQIEHLHTFPETHYVATLKPHLCFGCIGTIIWGHRELSSPDLDDRNFEMPKILLLVVKTTNKNWTCYWGKVSTLPSTLNERKLYYVNLNGIEKSKVNNDYIRKK